MTIHPRPLPLLVGVLVVPLVLTGCGGTPFGEALSRSFSGAADTAEPSPTAAGTAGPNALTSPAGTSPAPADPAAADNPPGDRSTGGATAPGKPPGDPSATGSGKATTQPATPNAPAPASPPTLPAPYRVTIRLPRADPSAPAEVVTRALRAAGVPFEVETIERMTLDGPTGTPEATKNPPATQTPRPAPAAP